MPAISGAHVRGGLSCALAACLLAVLLAPAALAAKPLTQKQYTEQTLKTAMTAWARKNVKGLEIGSASCVLPLNGNVVHCTVTSTAPSYREKIVFKVRETLHASGTMSWLVTAKACSNSRTGKAIAC